MITLAATALTTFHPGLVFGERWKHAGWDIRKENTFDLEGENMDEVANGTMELKE